MTELTEQEKLERRRQKRQQRILASAGDRLNRITGTAFPNRSSPTPSPSTSASSLAPSESLSKELPRSRSPSPALFGGAQPVLPADPAKRVQQQRRASDEDPCESLGAPPPLSANDPQIRSLEEFDAMLGLPPSSFSQRQPQADSINALNEMFGGQLPFNPAMLANMQGQQQPTEVTNDPSRFYWNLIHVSSMLWLGIYAVYTEWSTAGLGRFASLLWMNPAESASNGFTGVQFPLFWYFVTLELMMQAAQMFFQQGPAHSGSMLGTIAGQLPHPFSTVILTCLHYHTLWSCLVQDCCILVFVIGIAQVISAILAT
ncbi:hypothetical protein CLU79DRAFT_883885 [Phycomyces nitens]|nr:hypothetical protein CLU79DRAFT_883885 [Phycomyces nitens]